MMNFQHGHREQLLLNLKFTAYSIAFLRFFCDAQNTNLPIEKTCYHSRQYLESPS